MRDVIYEMSSKKLGMTCVVDAGDRLVGIITDGDLRRHMERSEDILSLNAADVMTKDPVSVPGSTLAVEALNIMEQRKITSLVVADGLEFFGAGKPYYDPAKITVPTLLIDAEWDRDAPPYMAQTLFPLLVNSPDKRYVELSEGTIMMEKNRLKLFEAVQAFLDESGRS